MRIFSLLIALTAFAPPALAEDCSECGLRRPGSRGRELAVLDSIDYVAKFREPDSGEQSKAKKVKRVPSSSQGANVETKIIELPSQ